MIARSEEEYDCIYKIILIGDSLVGKSNILSRFVTGTFCLECKTTVGVEFSSKIVSLGKLRVMAQIWDTAGQEKFRSITKAYYKGAAGAVIIYDITNKDSFKSIEKWVKELKEHADSNVIMMLAGNKLDLESQRQVDTEEGIDYAKKHGIFLDRFVIFGTDK